MNMEFDISKMVEKIVMQVEENQEEFIFETISPYCENIIQIKINKEELKQILLNGIQKPKIGRWVEENINEWTRKVCCSECGGPPPFEHVSNGDVYSAGGYGVIHKTKFCPNCGAKMEEES